MPCSGCGKKVLVPNTHQSAARAHKRAAEKRVSVKVRLKDSVLPGTEIVGKVTGAPYGKRKGGDIIRVWEGDYKAMQDLFDLQ